MNEEKIPYFVHEGMMARQERTIRRLWILCIIIFLAFVASNAAWIWYESQFEYEVTTQEVQQDVDTGNGAATAVGIGDIYGEDKADRPANNETQSS